MMRINNVTIDETWSRRQHGFVELWTLNVEDFLIFLILYLSLIVAFYLLFLDN